MPNWRDVLDEVKDFQKTNPDKKNEAIDHVRRKYLEQLHDHTGRNVIAYYSGFLSKPGIQLSYIVDEDKNGFMMAVHKLDRTKGLDLILHTPGGNIGATESLVDYLHRMFKDDIRVFVPQIAMSAGTMIACCCREILMCKHSNLGPIDPQIKGLPTYGVIEEFKRAHKEIKKDPSKLAVWQPIIGKYHPTFLGECANAIKRSNDFVRDHLINTMLKGKKNAETKAHTIVKKLTDYKGNKGHDRHIHIDECVGMGLKIVKVEDDPDLQYLLLTVHHCYMHSLMNTSAYKIIENQNGAALVKTQSAQIIQVPIGVPVTAPQS